MTQNATIRNGIYGPWLMMTGFPGSLDPGIWATSFTYVTPDVQKIAGGRAGDFRLDISRAKFSKTNTPVKCCYLPAKDSAAFAAKALDLLGLDSITFISCQS